MPQPKLITAYDRKQARLMGIHDARQRYERANPFTRDDPRWADYERGYTDQKTALLTNRNGSTRRQP